jgi:hypothetical protein
MVCNNQVGLLMIAADAGHMAAYKFVVVADHLRSLQRSACGELKLCSNVLFCVAYPGCNVLLVVTGDFSDAAVEEFAWAVRRSPAGEALDKQMLSEGLSHLDSRGLAALLKELARGHHGRRAREVSSSRFGSQICLTVDGQTWQLVVKTSGSWQNRLSHMAVST